MEWFLLESGVALLIAGLIVWWTMRPPRHRDASSGTPNGVAPDDRGEG